jgi:exonuclease SbcD
MIRILHTADWHIGQTFFGHDRTNEHRHFFEWLLSTIKKRHIDVLLVSGDVFDVSNPSAAAQHELYDFIRTASHDFPRLQMVFIAGNHDSAARLEAPVPLMEEMNVVVHGVVNKRDGAICYDELTVPLRGDSGEVEAICFAVPYLRQGDYPVDPSDENSYAEGVKRFYRTMLEQEADACKGLPIVAMGHMQVTGSEIAEHDYSERTVIGGLECVAPSVFADERIVYTALGHIHKAQRVSGMEKVRYAGSPLPMSFAEKFYNHGAVMVTIDGTATTIEQLKYVPLIPMMTIPPFGQVGPDAALAMIDLLPDGNKEEAQTFPYLEVKVLLDEPDPMLPQLISEHLEGKEARLARVVSSFKGADADEAGKESGESMSLKDMDPTKIFKTVFQNLFGSEASDEMLGLFDEACQSVIDDLDKEE